MVSLPPVVTRESYDVPFAVLRTQNEFGFVTADIVSPPLRLLPADIPTLPVIDQGIDINRLEPLPMPSQLMERLPDGDNWSAQSRRSLARLFASYLVAEDPQRRLDAREVSTLAHQVSLVRHVLDNDNLRRVLIADEVGLGKTVEVGLILKELLERAPQLRVLYFAPARLVPNVRREFDRMRLGFRQWSASDADARLSDSRIIASIHRAVHPRHVKAIIGTAPWDVVVVDECHHLSDWAQGGGDPREKFKLVREIIQRQSASGRVLLLSGTPHQGHGSRFENLVGLLRAKSEGVENLHGRVIYRTKDDVRDWDGNPLFPHRKVKEPVVVDLGPIYTAWITHIHDFFKPPNTDGGLQTGRGRAAGWRCAQALQWAASSPQAGVGYLVRQAIRAKWTLDDEVLRQSVASLRPYRGGAVNEPVEHLFQRIAKEIRQQDQDDDIEDIDETYSEDFPEETEQLRQLLLQGLEILRNAPYSKWQIVKDRILNQVGSEKVVFFAQPIETVTAFAAYLEGVIGHRPALIIGGQSDAEREKEVESFQRPDGPQFLVSSRAGGEGINLQVSRRLVHIDVPWNPMDMEQRVGRVHRFGSRRTILVETLVVKDSREEHAYHVAREKLKNITATMVEPERFEQVFSRVMCLVPPDELLTVLANSPLAPLTAGDQEVIARVVRDGFTAWQEFDRKFAESQRQIQVQNPGLATWDDVALFLQSFAKWTRADGFAKQTFAWADGELESVEEPARVLSSPGQNFFACGDHGGNPIFGPGDLKAELLGLNLPEVRETLHFAAFPSLPCGAFYMRWPEEREYRFAVGAKRFFAFMLLRQSVRTDQQSGWSEAGLTLHTYIADGHGKPRPIEGSERRELIHGLQAATPRVKSPSLGVGELAWLRDTENQLLETLRRPTHDEMRVGLRYAVWPTACGLIDFGK